MPQRETTFLPGHYYHLYNRGVDKRALFHETEPYAQTPGTFKVPGV